MEVEDCTDAKGTWIEGPGNERDGLTCTIAISHGIVHWNSQRQFSLVLIWFWLILLGTMSFTALLAERRLIYLEMYSVVGCVIMNKEGL